MAQEMQPHYIVRTTPRSMDALYTKQDLPQNNIENILSEPVPGRVSTDSQLRVYLQCFVSNGVQIQVR